MQGAKDDKDKCRHTAVIYSKLRRIGTNIYVQEGRKRPWCSYKHNMVKQWPTETVIILCFSHEKISALSISRIHQKTFLEWCFWKSTTCTANQWQRQVGEKKGNTIWEMDPWKKDGDMLWHIHRMGNQRPCSKNLAGMMNGVETNTNE